MSYISTSVLLWFNNISLYSHVTLCSFVHIDIFFFFLNTVDNFAMIFVCKFWCGHTFAFFSYITVSEISMLYGNSHKELINCVLQWLHYFIFPSTMLRECQVLYILANLKSIITVIPLGVKYNLIVVLICISPMANNVEHISCAYWIFFMSSLFICPF